MLSPRSIMTSLDACVNGMRRSRLKTLAAIVSAATRRRGVGVLALGRALPAPHIDAKHSIKRVWRFLRNDAVESEAVHTALLQQCLPASGPIVILADWTDLPPWRTLILAVACGGRALPFYSRTVPIKGKGGMRRAEAEAISFLARALSPGRTVVLVADRGFGNGRWVGLIRERGWSYVVRLGRQMLVCGEGLYWPVGDLSIVRGAEPWDWGLVTASHGFTFTGRLVSRWRADAKEQWCLATNLEGSAAAVCDLYAKRMGVELAIRDLKNQRLGMGLRGVRLSAAARQDRLVMVVMLAHWLLSVCGALAENRGKARGLRANTVKTRVLSWATIGWHTFHRLRTNLLQVIQLKPHWARGT